MNKVIISVIGIVIALNAGQAYTYSIIKGSQINPSTNLRPISNSTIDQIADEITIDRLPFNGFISYASSGTISLDLDGQYDLNSFIIWNDVNVFQEGIKDFRLDFFNDSNGLISSSPTFVAPFRQRNSQEYVFNDLISGVSKVDLVVLNSNPSAIGPHYHRIEVREVAFTGSPTVTVKTPEPTAAAGLLLLGTIGAGSMLKRQRQDKAIKDNLS